MSDAKFIELAPRICEGLAQEFQKDGFKYIDTYAVTGNLGHESGGFKFLQELKPIVVGSRGGWGWAQWTGPRRRLFEAKCKEWGLDASSYEMNFRFLVWELRSTSERVAIPATIKAVGLEGKVRAFEAAFERAGVKHYESRYRYARLAQSVHTGGKLVDPTSATDLPPARIQHGKWPEQLLSVNEIKVIQRRLRELNYTMVGKVDGDWGPNTRNAIFAFQSDRKIAADGHWGPATRSQMLLPGLRPVSEARVKTTEADLVAQGSQTMIAAKKIDWGGSVMAIGGAVSALLVGAFEVLPDAIETLRPYKDQLPNLPAWIWPIAAIGLGVYIKKHGKIVKHQRLEDERQGLHDGRPDPTPSPPVTETGP